MIGQLFYCAQLVLKRFAMEKSSKVFQKEMFQDRRLLQSTNHSSVTSNLRCHRHHLLHCLPHSLLLPTLLLLLMLPL